MVLGGKPVTTKEQVETKSAEVSSFWLKLPGRDLINCRLFLEPLRCLCDYCHKLILLPCRTIESFKLENTLKIIVQPLT